jgi:hypothetical protein
MSTQKLIERQLQVIAKPGDYGAGGVPGFALRVYPSGKRSWLRSQAWRSKNSGDSKTPARDWAPKPA